MSNLGLFAGSSFMHIFISLQIWGDMPGGIVGLKPSRATWGPKQTNILEMYAGQKQRSLFTMNSKNSTHYEVVTLGSKIKINHAHLHANFHVRQVSKWHFSGHQLPEQDSKAPHVCWPTVDLFRLLLQSCRSQESTSMSQKYWQWDTGRSAASMCKPTVTAPGNKVIFLGGSSLSLLHLTTLIPFKKKCKKIASSVEI